MRIGIYIVNIGEVNFEISAKLQNYGSMFRLVSKLAQIDVEMNNQQVHSI